jgi:hypothetical protein
VVTRTAPSRSLAACAKPLLLGLVAVSLVSGVLGGLARYGVAPSSFNGNAWLSHALLWHAGLMVCGFLGTVIGIERAVAVKHPAAFLAPAASATGGLMLVLGRGGAGAALLVSASVLFVAVNVVVVRRQQAAHTLLLLLSSITWLAGNLLFLAGRGGGAAIACWFAFLVMTIAAERLEMTRLMRRRPAATGMLVAVLAWMLVGAASTALWPVFGGVVYGASLVMLAAWLGVFDIARRTVFARGLSRYMAVCLIAGYGWLAIAGAAWAATAVGLPLRDAALHALGLGFVFSMIMGHAPVILPAVARVKLHFGGFFYVPLAALHLSLAWRLGGSQWAQRAAGGALNAVSLALFAATVLGAAAAWHRKYGAHGAAARS